MCVGVGGGTCSYHHADGLRHTYLLVTGREWDLVMSAPGTIHQALFVYLFIHLFCFVLNQGNAVKYFTRRVMENMLRAQCMFLYPLSV